MGGIARFRYFPGTDMGFAGRSTPHPEESRAPLPVHLRVGRRGRRPPERGNNTNSDTWFAEHVTPSVCSEVSGQARNGYELWREDVDLAAGMGPHAYRFPVEQARVEPTEEPSTTRRCHYEERFVGNLTLACSELAGNAIDTRLTVPSVWLDMPSTAARSPATRRPSASGRGRCRRMTPSGGRSGLVLGAWPASYELVAIATGTDDLARDVRHSGPHHDQLV